MAWIPLQTFPPESDLTALHIYLEKLEIPHQFTEELHEQVLWVPNARTGQSVQNAMRKLASNPDIVRTTPAPKITPSALALPSLKQAPATWLLTILCILGFGLVWFSPLYACFTFLPYQQKPADFFAAWRYWQASGEFWRIVSPAFLHFSVLHIVFNAMWLMDLGKRLELYFGSARFLLLFLFLAIGGNCAQYWIAPENIFGGVSAVIYGLFGFIAMVQRFDAHHALALPKSIFIVMLGFMLVGFSGVLDSILGPMANAGHLGGFVSGVLSGICYGFWLKRNRINKKVN